MEKVYQAILTEKGRDKLAAAAITGEQVGFTMMGVGDGGGQSAVPFSAQDSLINELYRASLNRLVIADQAANVIRAEMVMQPQVGGFWLREAGLYDDAGDCLAVANLPPSYKPMLAEGAGRLQAINLWIAVSNTADVQLMTDPTVMIASVDEVERAKNEAKDYTDEVLGDLDTNIKQIIAEAVKTAVSDAWELDNPVGTTRFFNQNINPNERWPWSQWVYTGENKTIRVGKADGSDVGQTGGSDTVTIQRANLPAVQVDVSGETSEQEELKLTTTRGGVHNHGGVAGKDDPWEIGGDVRQLFNPKELGVTDDAGEHDHEITVPPHKHTTTGKTDNLGEGKSISVVEAHTLLMCWSRVA
ncbi:phage tail protein [Klebsiella pneumoniae]|uniref:phage tail protein n=1 Tax=Klebsiella pneumoniae TaxID=573 RepID=UPI00132F8D98|nr:phage tail protein [Klebsiella pneumoniae]MCP5647233.1 phage tail protein [Klebsiella pneumoniae]HCB1368672.1 phage tail protein [Klebsiella pneumoniae]HDE1364404.1 phage tail protein [Klebsiella pneumoniae]HED9619221.1 phage tail protein [Klebsiella pneumoniae]HEE5032022.1 phage tail protein [Klebsiella pneumoniae]